MTTLFAFTHPSRNIPKNLFSRCAFVPINGTRCWRALHVPVGALTPERAAVLTEKFWKRNIFSSPSRMTALNNLTFDNSVLRSLPIDPEEKVFPRQVKGACFSKVTPTPVENPQLVSAALPALQLLDLGEDDIEHKDFTEYFSGNKLLKGSETAAHCYCGHQFGHFAGQLGDGAAM